MAIFKWANVVRSQTGDSLVGWQVECVKLADNETVVPIFSDENGTPISSESGVVNRAVTDEIGNYQFFVASGTYSLRFYDPVGEFRRLDRFITMYGAADPIPLRPQTGTAYTLTIEDSASLLEMTNASAIALTIPPDSDVAFEDGTFMEVHQGGAGAVTFTAGAGVTINERQSHFTTAGQYAVAGLRKTGANVWTVIGDIA